MFFFWRLQARVSNQIFHYTRWITPKRVTSWRGPSPRHCARATQLLSKKCRSGGEPLATLCPIWPARDLNLRPPAPETNALPLDQLAGRFACFWPKGYQLGTLGKSHQNGDYSKQAMRKIVFPQESNLQPLDYRSTALPLELEKTPPRMLNFGYLKIKII